MMVSPLAHKRHLKQLTGEEILELMHLVVRAQEELDKVLSPQGYNIGINIGACAGAGIDKHLHIHVVPRWKGDVNFMPVTAKTKVISESLEALYKKLEKSIKNA